MEFRYIFGNLDWTIIFVIIGALICMAASSNVKSTFKKYAMVRSMSGLTGAQAAARILQTAGINDVAIQPIRGELTDNYNPSRKTLNLSESVYDSTSIAAIGVAAHECGHAIQHHKGYAPLNFRSALVPVANIGSALSWPIIIFGVIFSFKSIMHIGIFCFSLAVLFQLVTLPVEFNASHRALNILQTTGILGNEEVSSTRKVLGAAALTYVASAAAAILQLLRLIILFGGGGRRRD